jgi:hypothetical protein
MDITMNIKLRLRYILLLFWLVQSLGAFADKGSKHPTEDKPDKPRKTLGIPPVVLPNVLKLENATLKGVASNTASKAMMLQNVQLSNALDKAVAQMGDAMSLMDYSDMPAERVEAFVDASTNTDRAEAQTLFDEIAKGNRYIKAINKGAVLALPQGIRWGDVDEAGNSKGGNSITVGISSAIFKPEYTVLKMYVKIEMETPAGSGSVNTITKKTLFFGSDNIKLSQDGGFIGDARLVLLGDYTIPFGKYDFTLRGGLNKATGQFADFTYVSIDCDGFKELKISGLLDFPRNVIVPIDGVTGVVEPDISKRVKGEINTTIYDINDLRFDVTLPAFALASAPDWGFVVQGAVFDFSTRTNSPGTVFPEKYATDYFPPETDGSLAINTWRGVFVKNLEVLLPKPFRKKIDKNKTIIAKQKITAQNLLIDERGVSGSFSKEPVIQLSEGDASDWDFSVDKIRVDFETNKLVGGAFNGILQLPISSDATAQLAYAGEIAPVGDLTCTVTLKDGISFDAFKGYIKLTTGTGVTLESRNGKFIPTATINGEMGIYVKTVAAEENTSTNGEVAQTATEKKDATVQIPQIKIQNLVLTGDPAKPWISLGYAGYEKEIKLSYFPASITGIAIGTTPTTCFLRLGVKVSLMKDNFSATTVLKFNGKITSDKKIISDSPSVTVESIKLDSVNVGPFILTGTALIKDDRTEKGWGGAIALTITKPTKINIGAVASFGYNRTEDFRYWYVGASYGKGVWTDATTTPKVGILGVQHAVVALFSNCTPKQTITQINRSGLDPNVTSKKGIIGFTGLIKIGTVAIDAEAGLELALNSNWGLNRFGIIGSATLSTTSKAANPTAMGNKFKDWLARAKVGSQNPQNGWRDVAYNDFNPAQASSDAFKIRLLLNGDFEKGIYHGECDFYVNIGKTLKGNQPNGLAGKLVAHVETKANNEKYPGKNMWYFHAGNPNSRITVGANLLGNTFKTGFYLMTGFGLPASMPLPAFYQKALGYKGSRYVQPNYGDLQSGTLGTAFGAEFSYSQRREFGLGIVYAYYSLRFGMGFDFISRDCGSGSCTTTYGSNSTWLSSAQAYAYIEGSVGVGIDLWLFSAEVELINAGVGALISANFPKPFGGCAELIVWYKIWKYKGSFGVNYKFGDECRSCNGGTLPCPSDNF